MKHLKLFMLTIVAMISSANYAMSQNTNADQASDSIVLVKVKGVTCSVDLKMIITNLENLEGVNSCKTVKEGATTVFEVSFDPLQVTEKQIYAAIENTGSCEGPDDRPYKVKQ